MWTALWCVGVTCTGFDHDVPSAGEEASQPMSPAGGGHGYRLRYVIEVDITSGTGQTIAPVAGSV